MTIARTIILLALASLTACTGVHERGSADPCMYDHPAYTADAGTAPPVQTCRTSACHDGAAMGESQIPVMPTSCPFLPPAN